MSRFFIAGGIIALLGAVAGFGFEKEWGLYIVIGGSLIALPSLFGF
jgi:hypothetical protein